MTGKLLVQLLDPKAAIPTVSFAGEDLGYDLYALQNTFIALDRPTKVLTGIAAVYVSDTIGQKFGLEVKDRSGNASKLGLHVLAGTIDAGYRGEVCVIMVLLGPAPHRHPNGHPGRGYQILAGDKIAQMLPREVLTSAVEVVDSLPEGVRGTAGFGSTGR